MTTEPHADIVERLRLLEARLPDAGWLDAKELRVTAQLVRMVPQVIAEIDRLRAILEKEASMNEIPIPSWAKWSIGQFVRKRKGSQWRGRIVGFYSTDNNPRGYAIESHYEENSVQIYPEAALEDWKP